MFLSFNKPSQVHIDGREFSRSIKSKGIIISETTPWGWHGIKQSSGKHNTINILLTRVFRVLGEYSVEVAVLAVNQLLNGSGGSTPSSPIHCLETESLVVGKAQCSTW